MAGWLLAWLATAAAAAPAFAQGTHVAEPLPGITTSGQPDAAALSTLADRGFVAVIDLRTPDEERGLDEAETVGDLGMAYVSLPVDGAAGVTYANAAALDEILRGLARPVLIHCSTGNRAGALLALRQRLLGVDADEALRLGVAAGMTNPALQSVVEAELDEPPTR